MEHTHHAGHGDHAEESHHVTPPFVYWRTYFLLLIFMVLTIAAYKVNLGPALNNVVAMAIAITKATLVVLFFMQVKYGTRLTWLWAGLGFVWLLLIFITLQDYMSRRWIPIPGWG